MDSCTKLLEKMLRELDAEIKKNKDADRYVIHIDKVCAPRTERELKCAIEAITLIGRMKSCHEMVE